MANTNGAKEINISSKEIIKKILVADGKLIKRVSLDEIICIQSDHHYSNITLKRGKNLLCSRPLSDFESRLPDYFFRIHKSAIVNLRHFVSFNEHGVNQARLTNDIEIKVAHRRKSEFVRALYRACG